MVTNPSSLAEAIKKDAPKPLELVKEPNKIIQALKEKGEYNLEIGNEKFLIISNDQE